MTRPSDTLLGWAAVGSRISGFHHDSASKLQSMMMALDEAQDFISDTNPDAQRALEVALGALRELHGLLTENRALAKPPVRKDLALADLLAFAGRRFGVALRGEIPATTVHVSHAPFGHALALLLDVIAGPVQGARSVDLTVRAEASHVVLDVAGQPGGVNAADSIAVATWLVEREGGAVYSAPRGFLVQVPTSAASAAVSS